MAEKEILLVCMTVCVRVCVCCSIERFWIVIIGTCCFLVLVYCDNGVGSITSNQFVVACRFSSAHEFHGSSLAYIDVFASKTLQHSDADEVRGSVFVL